MDSELSSSMSPNDADAAAGTIRHLMNVPSSPTKDFNDYSHSAPKSTGTSTTSLSTTATSNEIEPMISIDDLYDSSTHHDHNYAPLTVLGVNLSHFNRKAQFIICATGVFGFSLLYGYLQELISVTLCSRQLGLFLAMVQFFGYATWSAFFSQYVARKDRSASLPQHKGGDKRKLVPIKVYIFLSCLRATDAVMTNMAMTYVNYPAKTLLKSSRVVFTMIFGSIVSGKRYKPHDYAVVFFMVLGLAIFMHADSKSSAIFNPIGIAMLMLSLACDGVTSNLSEVIMNTYDIGQDEFIYKLYSISFVGILMAALVRGDCWEGMRYIMLPGTYNEILEDQEATWSASSKIIAFVLFSSAGFFGSSCSAAITKNFGALTMSITSTARKATTLFLSFAIFNHVCTVEHLLGIILFISALVGKSLRASQKETTGNGAEKRRSLRVTATHIEMGNMGLDSGTTTNRIVRRGAGRVQNADVV